MYYLLPDVASTVPGGFQTLLKFSLEIAILRLIPIRSHLYQNLNKDSRLMLTYRGTESYSGTADLIIAVHYFNNGNGSVVREVQCLK